MYPLSPRTSLPPLLEESSLLFLISGLEIAILSERFSFILSSYSLVYHLVSNWFINHGKYFKVNLGLRKNSETNKWYRWMLRVYIPQLCLAYSLIVSCNYYLLIMDFKYIMAVCCTGIDIMRWNSKRLWLLKTFH